MLHAPPCPLSSQATCLSELSCLLTPRVRLLEDLRLGLPQGHLLLRRLEQVGEHHQHHHREEGGARRVALDDGSGARF